MLICIDETRKVLWYNAEISKEGSQKYLTENVLWIDGIILPQYPTLEKNKEAELLLSEENTLYYKNFEKVTSTTEPTETEMLMQAFADAELRDMESQKERQFLAQQFSDLELALLERG